MHIHFHARGRAKVLGHDGLERHQKYDHKIDQDRNGDANHIHGNLDDQVSFQVEHDYNGKEKVAIIGCES
jgi:hypothetical protein